MQRWDKLLQGEPASDLAHHLREEFMDMEHQEVWAKTATYHDVTVFDISYRGFWTYGRIAAQGYTYAVRLYEGWTAWEVVR